LLLVLLFLFTIPSVLRSQTPGWSLDGPAFTASVADIQTAAARVHAEPFANSTVLFEQEKYALDSNGRVSYSHQLIYRIENKAGLESWNEVSADWNPWYQNQPMIRARVLQLDGRVSELDPHTLTDGPAKQDAGRASRAQGPVQALMAESFPTPHVTRMVHAPCELRATPSPL